MSDIKAASTESETGRADQAEGGLNAPSRRSIAISGIGAFLKYRHMFKKDPKLECTFYDLQPDLSALDNPIISCSDTFWAIPYRGGGGPVYVSRHGDFGKVMPECVVLNAHKSSVQDIAFSPFHSGLMATASADATVKIWNLLSKEEEEDLVDLDKYRSACASPSSKEAFTSKMSTMEPVCAATTHTNSLRTCNFHPTVPHLICSTAQDNTLRVFDVSPSGAGKEVSCFHCLATGGSILPSFAPSDTTQMVNNISFNYDGTLVLLATKDRSLKIMDLRTGKIVAVSESQLAASIPTGSVRSSVALNRKTIGRNLRAAWCCTPGFDPIVSASASSSGQRTLHVWDVRNLEKPTQSKMIDNGSGQLFPIFDEDLSTLFVAGKGDTMLRTYEFLYSTLEEGAGSCSSSSGVNSGAAVEETGSKDSTGSGGGGGGTSPMRLGRASVSNRSSLAMSPKRGVSTGASGGTFGASTTASGQSGTEGTSTLAEHLNSNSAAVFFEKSAEFPTAGDAFAGFCLVPKRALDVRDVEIARVMKLTSTGLFPFSFHAPRAEYIKQYFQDDVYLPTRSKRAAATVDDWVRSAAKMQSLAADAREKGGEESGAAPAAAAAPMIGGRNVADFIFQPLMDSLRPEDMTNVSEKPEEIAAPSETKSKVNHFKAEIAKQEAETKARETVFNRLQQLAVQSARYNVNKSGPMKAEVARAVAGGKGSTTAAAGAAASSSAGNAADEDSSDGGWSDDD